MEKTILEKRISQRAEERYEQEYNALYKALSSNKIARLLKITIGEKEITDFVDDSQALITNCSKTAEISELSNFAEIKKNLIIIYEKEETDKILNELSALSYLFVQNNH